VFFASILGCTDAGMTSGSKLVGAGATACSLFGFVFALAGYCLWTVIPYVTSIQSNPPSVWMPVWTNQASNEMTALQVYDTWLGPGWITALTASILTFIAMVIHCVSLANDSYGFMDDEDSTRRIPAQLVQKDGGMAGSIPASAINPVYSGQTNAVSAANVPSAIGSGKPADTDIENV
jgi:hypothetical protein